MKTELVVGRLVLEAEVAGGRLLVENGLITDVTLDTSVDGPLIAPGFVDVHVHGYGGHDAMGGPVALTEMARALLRRGVTSFLPSAVSAPLEELHEFCGSVRTWRDDAPGDGAEPLGFNLEGPFLSPARRGAHDAAYLVPPADVPAHAVEPLLAGLALTTIAPELPGALELIERLSRTGIGVSLGHSAASFEQALAGYSAGARSTTHLFNAMSGFDHREPGLAVAALLNDDAYVELIADGVHVSTEMWPIITRLKPTDRLILVSDAHSLAGTTDARGSIGGQPCEVVDGRIVLAGTNTLVGSAIALDTAVRNLVRSGVPLPAAVKAASSNPLALLGVADRGRLAPGQRADLVELGDDLTLRRVMRAGTWREAQP